MILVVGRTSRVVVASPLDGVLSDSLGKVLNCIGYELRASPVWFLLFFLYNFDTIRILDISRSTRRGRLLPLKQVTVVVVFDPCQARLVQGSHGHGLVWGYRQQGRTRQIAAAGRWEAGEKEVIGRSLLHIVDFYLLSQCSPFLGRRRFALCRALVEYKD